MKRPTIAEVVDELSKIDTTIIDELNKIDTDRSSPIEQVYSHTAGTGDIFIFDLPFFASVHRICLSSCYVDIYRRVKLNS